MNELFTTYHLLLNDLLLLLTPFYLIFLSDLVSLVCQFVMLADDSLASAGSGPDTTPLATPPLHYSDSSHTVGTAAAALLLCFWTHPLFTTHHGEPPHHIDGIMYDKPGAILPRNQDWRPA